MHETSFNPKVIYESFLIKLSADVSEYLQTFQQVMVFYFLANFKIKSLWRMSFCSQFSCLKKANTVISNFSVFYRLKINVF